MKRCKAIALQGFLIFKGFDTIINVFVDFTIFRTWSNDVHLFKLLPRKSQFIPTFRLLKYVAS